MTRQTRRRFSPEYEEQAVARLLAPGATQASVAAELGVTPTQLRTWRLELEAAGSASAIERQQAEAGRIVAMRWTAEVREINDGRPAGSVRSPCTVGGIALTTCSRIFCQGSRELHQPVSMRTGLPIGSKARINLDRRTLRRFH